MAELDPAPLIEAEGVSVGPAHDPILADVALSVEPGAIHALMGPNGGGKTTLLRALLGELDFRGRIRFHWRGSGRIGYVPQRFGTDGLLSLTVAEALGSMLQLRPVWLGLAATTRTRLEAALARVGLVDRADAPLATLSGGELQRVLLAQAWLREPELLVLDEPARALDAPSAARLEESLAALSRDLGTTILMVSHDAAQVQRLAGRVTWIDGRVLASGPPSEVLARMGGKP